MLSVYLDNASTTPTDSRVLEAMLPYLTDHFGNPSSVHRFGQTARNAIDKARRQLADLILCSPNEIVFTSGGTESNNLAIQGLAKRFLGGHIVTTSIEHSAVREVVKGLAADGFEVTEVKTDSDGVISPASIAAAVRENTFLITVMLANNELGTLQPLREISHIVSELRESGRDIHLHSDAVQALGKIPIDIRELGCDLISFSAHKLYAPKGTGALYVRKGVRLEPLQKGGPHERRLRPGTENAPGIVAFGKACEISRQCLAEESMRITELRRRFETTLKEQIPGVSVNGGENRLPGISNISFEGIEGEALLIMLDQMGVAVSTGSACASGTIEPSHVLLSIGRSEGIARSSLRFSFGRFNEIIEVDMVVQCVRQAVEELRRR